MCTKLVSSRWLEAALFIFIHYSCCLAEVNAPGMPFKERCGLRSSAERNFSDRLNAAYSGACAKERTFAIFFGHVVHLEYRTDLGVYYEIYRSLQVRGYVEYNTYLDLPKYRKFCTIGISAFLGRLKRLILNVNGFNKK